MAGLKTVAEQGVTAAFQALRDFTEEITITAITSLDYDTTTGTTTAQTDEQSGVKALMLEYEQMDGEIILEGDRMVLVQSKDLTIEISGSVQTLTFDRSGGETWTVVKKELDPSESVWTWQARRGT